MSFISNFKFQISNLICKNNLPSILTVILLIFTVGILFWYGDKKIKEAENIQSTVLAWKNLDDKNTPNNLAFIIQNLEPKKNNYQIEFLLNEQKIDSLKIEINSQRKEIVQPTKKIIKTLMSLSTSSEILYQTKITWKKRKKIETIGKWLKR